MMLSQPGVIPHQTITTIVEQVDQARQDVQQAFDLLQFAQERLRAVLGEEPRMSLWPRDISDYNLERTAADIDAHLARQAWRYVLDQTGLAQYMTSARQQELRAQLEGGEFPPLTVANVLSTLEGLHGQLGTLLLESVREVFDWLRPRHSWGVGVLKTNSAWKVGMKVIIGGAVTANYSSGYRLNYYSETHFRTLGNVLSLLDGQGVLQYPHDLCTRLNAALATASAGDPLTIGPYLTCKPYRNGHLHVTFLRQDLVDRLNQLGADGATLPSTR